MRRKVFTSAPSVAAPPAAPLLSSGAGRGLSGTVAATLSREQRRGGGREEEEEEEEEEEGEKGKRRRKRMLWPR